MLLTLVLRRTVCFHRHRPPPNTRIFRLTHESSTVLCIIEESLHISHTTADTLKVFLVNTCLPVHRCQTLSLLDAQDLVHFILTREFLSFPLRGQVRLAFRCETVSRIPYAGNTDKTAGIFQLYILK